MLYDPDLRIIPVDSQCFFCYPLSQFRSFHQRLFGVILWNDQFP